MAFALAGLSLLGVLIGAALQYAFNRHIELRKLFIAQKALAYTDYFKAVAGLAQQRTGELLAVAADAKTRICLFGGSGVIRSLHIFESTGAAASSIEGQQTLLRLLQEMRQDLLGASQFSNKAEVMSILFGPPHKID